MTEKLVPMTELVQQMQSMPDEATLYYRRSTGEFVMVQDSYVEMLEAGALSDDSDDLADWEQEELKTAEEILHGNDGGDFVPLPPKDEMDEYSMMEGFCDSIEESRIADDLFDAISGKGAFRRFKDAVHRHSVEQQWYRFKDERYKEIAREWCEENGISCIE